MKTEVRMTVRIPVEADDFLGRAAKENFTSRNAEIVRCIRERALREGEMTTAGNASKGDTPPPSN